MLFGADYQMNWELHDQLVRTYLRSGLLFRRSQVSQNRVWILHRQVILFLVKEACVACGTTGLSPWNSANDQLSTAVLMANDQLGNVPPSKISNENNLGSLTNLVAAGEGSRFGAWRHKLVRSSMILRNILGVQEVRDKFDVSRLFEEVTAVSFETYLAMVFAITTKALTEPPTSAMLPSFSSINEAWFKETRISSTEIAALLRDISVSPDEIASQLTSRPVHVNDFTCFADRPLIRVLDQFYPIDFDFLTNKAETGIFWRVVRSLPKVQQNAFFAFWGEVFERYINWLLDRSVNPLINVLHLDPRYRDNTSEQVCDAIILNGSNACLLEDKGITFTSDAKYSGNAEILKKEIEIELLGTPSDRKGLRQLAEAIITDSELRRDIDGVDLSLVAKIFPVLVVRDDVALTPYFGEYLNFRFRKLLVGKKLSRIVTPLFVITADEMERIAGHLDRTKLSDILEARWRAEKKLKLPFFAIRNPKMADAKHGPPPIIREGVEILANTTARKLFGIEA